MGRPESLSELVEPKDQDLDLTGVLMHLCMLVIMQDTSHIKLYKLLIIHYLAVRGIDKKSKALRLLFFYMLILASAL